MRTAFFFFVGVAACFAEGREAWRVERYAEGTKGTDGTKGTCVVVAGSREVVRRSWLPRVSVGWPFGRAWMIKWEGTF